MVQLFGSSAVPLLNSSRTMSLPERTLTTLDAGGRLRVGVNTRVRYFDTGFPSSRIDTCQMSLAPEPPGYADAK